MCPREFPVGIALHRLDPEAEHTRVQCAFDRYVTEFAVAAVSDPNTPGVQVGIADSDGLKIAVQHKTAMEFAEVDFNPPAVTVHRIILDTHVVFENRGPVLLSGGSQKLGDRPGEWVRTGDRADERRVRMSERGLRSRVNVELYESALR